MAITYNKKTVTKDRRVMPSGPRDRQRKQQMEQQIHADHSELIAELRNQISTLQDRLASAPQGGYSAEQVNAEIMAAIKEETADLKKKHSTEKKRYEAKAEELVTKMSALEEDLHEYKTKNKLLEKDIEVLKEKISEKDKRIEKLESRKPETDNNVTALLAEATKKIEALSAQVAAAGNHAEIVDSKRPQLKEAFVDPIEKESKVERHFEVEVEDVSINKKEEMGSKVDKLKSLLGSLPSKR